MVDRCFTIRAMSQKSDHGGIDKPLEHEEDVLNAAPLLELPLGPFWECRGELYMKNSWIKARG